jgi:hypothetical protein
MKPIRIDLRELTAPAVAGGGTRRCVGDPNVDVAGVMPVAMFCSFALAPNPSDSIHGARVIAAGGDRGELAGRSDWAGDSHRRRAAGKWMARAAGRISTSMRPSDLFAWYDGARHHRGLN